jgi:hypothetical protein
MPEPIGEEGDLGGTSKDQLNGELLEFIQT